jgi:hypothetical protein
MRDPAGDTDDVPIDTQQQFAIPDGIPGRPASQS